VSHSHEVIPPFAAFTIIIPAMTAINLRSVFATPPVIAVIATAL